MFNFNKQLNFLLKITIKAFVYFLLFFLILFWGIDGEINYYGEFVQNAKRTVEFFPIESSTYTVVWDDGQTMVKEASSFLYIVQRVIGAIGIIEGLFVLKEIIFGTVKIRRTLRPLDEIAKTASRLSNMTFDEAKFQSLEDAISKISPVISDEKISTGDSELHGLEEAINNLLERMRDSYKQQARFVSDASHELRTPISVIQGYANMLDRWGKNDKEILEESINAIKNETDSMQDLIEKLLFIARSDKQAVSFTKEDFRICEILFEVNTYE